MLTIRTAREQDAEAIARLFVEMETPDPPPDAAHVRDRMLPRVVVACDDEGVVGYASWRIYGRIAHVANVVVDRRLRGTGVGRALMDTVRATVTAAGCTRWYLNVKQDNAPARKLYRRSGMADEVEQSALKLAWAQVDALPGEHATTAVTPTPEDDAMIAARFGLPHERLGYLRSRRETRVVAVRDGSGELAAYAAFDPPFPGASLFVAARPALARPLLDACRVHADHARFDFIRVAIYGDRALRDALIAAGAELTFDLLQMGASLEP